MYLAAAAIASRTTRPHPLEPFRLQLVLLVARDAAGLIRQNTGQPCPWLSGHRRWPARLRQHGRVEDYLLSHGISPLFKTGPSVAMKIP